MTGAEGGFFSFLLVTYRMRKIFILLLFITLLPAAAFTHPHMFIDMQTEAVFTEAGFSGLKVRWLFDMVFTGSVLMDNSIDWKEEFSKDDIEIIRDTSFINLKNYGYYTYFNLDGRISRPDSFSGFTAFMKDNRLGYEFFLPSDEAGRWAQEIRIAVYDETYFCDIAYTAKQPISINSGSAENISWELSEDKDAPIYYDNTAQMVSRDGATYSGQAFPVELVLKVSR